MKGMNKISTELVMNIIIKFNLTINNGKSIYKQSEENCLQNRFITVGLRVD
jgi:hypothetical protein